MSNTVLNGKNIYQLTPATALKGTDIIPISSENLTRSTTVNQLKGYFKQDFYDKDAIDNFLEQIRSQISGASGNIFEFQEYINEFKRDINNRFQEFTQAVNIDLNNIEKKITETNNSTLQVINQLDTTLSTKITNVEKNLTEKINGLYSYGTQIPTSLPAGKLYVQYF